MIIITYVACYVYLLVEFFLLFLFVIVFYNINFFFFFFVSIPFFILFCVSVHAILFVFDLTLV